MKRVPPLRRKDQYIAEIDAARKRQKLYEERRDPLCDYEENIAGEQYDMVETPPAYANKLTSRRYRVVQRKCLAHDPEYYQRTSVALNAPQVIPSTSKDSNVHYVESVQKPGEVIYAQYDDYRTDINEYYDVSNPMLDVVPQITLSGRNRVVHKSNASFHSTRRSDVLYTQKESTPHISVQQNEMPESAFVDVVDEESKSDFVPQPPLVMNDIGEHADIFDEDYVSMGVGENELDNEYSHDNVADHYGYYESAGGDCGVQEQVEIVDDEIDIDELSNDSPSIEPNDNSRRHYPNTQRHFKAAGPIDMYKFYELMAREEHQSNEELMDYFLSDPAMSHPLNVTGLIAACRNSSPELNAQAIASLGMQVNYLKKSVSKLKQDVADLRALCLSQDNPMFSSGRRFDPSAEVSREWRIPAISPLAEVNLVEVAREMSSMRMGKRSARNEDLIRRFVRIILERLVPKHMVRAFTVRDRERANGHHPQDIGDFAKNQITGAVLDLMGLHTFNERDSRARAERAYYFQLTNRLMKCAIYDMRRMTPKKRDAY